jgi:hypothetical protein
VRLVQPPLPITASPLLDPIRAAIRLQKWREPRRAGGAAPVPVETTGNIGPSGEWNSV